MIWKHRIPQMQFLRIQLLQRQIAMLGIFQGGANILLNFYLNVSSAHHLIRRVWFHTYHPMQRRYAWVRYMNQYPAQEWHDKSSYLKKNVVLDRDPFRRIAHIDTRRFRFWATDGYNPQKLSSCTGQRYYHKFKDRKEWSNHSDAEVLVQKDVGI